MIRSMTAFGRAKIEGQERTLSVEIKSVNSRFFDCSVKLPRAYSFFEDRIRNYVQQNALYRGKVDVYISVDNHSSLVGDIAIDEIYAESYLKALVTLRDRFSLRDDISVMSLARNQEIFKVTKPDEDLEADWALIRSALDEAIAGYVEMRNKEGERIKLDVEGKLAHITELLSRVEEISREDNVGYRDKLEARLRAILGDNGIVADEARLLTECAVWADKIAIDEEVVRLRAHLMAFGEIAASTEPSGRKLDFLIQEMNRETNTIGSKANNARIARLVVDMKGEIEKIREQIQNVE